MIKIVNLLQKRETIKNYKDYKISQSSYPLYPVSYTHLDVYKRQVLNTEIDMKSLVVSGIRENTV